MVKEASCIVLLLLFTFQPTIKTVKRTTMAGMKNTSTERADDFEKNLPFSQAIAPFEGYTENINGVMLELARMPQGSFLMGNDNSPNTEEKPAHQVNLRSFYIGQYEITRKQWNAVAETLPKVNQDLKKHFVGPAFGGAYEENSPADAVFWDDAVEFCDRLTKYSGKKYRLPSEAEWEYACRAGTQTEYSWGNEVNYNYAHFKNTLSEESFFYLFPVGRKAYANA